MVHVARLKPSGVVLMEGYLKKKLSLLKGYRDQWFVLTQDGYLKYYLEKPMEEKQKPKGQILLLLSDINEKSDNVSFKVKAANNNVFRLRADNKEKRNAWIKAMIETKTKLNNRMFKGFYDTGERLQRNIDQENDDTGAGHFLISLSKDESRSFHFIPDLVIHLTCTPSLSKLRFFPPDRLAAVMPAQWGIEDPIIQIVDCSS
ncbi:unnamed protein product [Mytilus edulis]|uniref:PH domain-containing protein n=1 Tax=Mytilus edulis TaxID=6550 RepID=A0A8S3Q9U3_MYTED|nr:unnamed protein product [Mytilus edulis]